MLDENSRRLLQENDALQRQLDESLHHNDELKRQRGTVIFSFSQLPRIADCIDEESLFVRPWILEFFVDVHLHLH
jgi:hypothetical protein